LIHYELCQVTSFGNHIVQLRIVASLGCLDGVLHDAKHTNKQKTAAASVQASEQGKLVHQVTGLGAIGQHQPVQLKVVASLCCSMASCTAEEQTIDSSWFSKSC
jgi:hypothetical protein